MKRKVFLSFVLALFVLGLTAVAFSGSVHQFDKKGYSKIAKKTVGRVISGNVDADKMLSDMEKLVTIGVAGCKEHMGEKETPPEEAKMMELVIANADKMKSLSLEDIEAQWHEGGKLKANGVDLNKYDHFSEVMCHLDAVVHPATAIICLKKYKETKKADLLEQVQAELQEVIEHLKHLD